MAPQIPRPSSKLDTNQFYSEYLPELWASLRVPEEPRTNLHFELGAEIHGEALTQRFAMITEDSNLNVKAGLPDRAHLTFFSDEDSLRIAAFDLLPRVINHVNAKLGGRAPGSLIQKFARRVEPNRLYEFPGRVRVRYTDDAGDIAEVEIRVAGGEGPEASIEADDADLWAFLNGKTKLSQLLRTRIRIDGDVAYLLRVIGVVEPK